VTAIRGLIDCLVSCSFNMVYLLLSRLPTRGRKAIWHQIMGEERLSAHSTAEVVIEEVLIDIHRV
jgi:hypothetical protein